jgi:hypothetical protein
VELNLETGKVEVVFDDILLPDSTTNYEASNGFVSFRIQARSDIPEFTPVFNSAGIFFDLNPPILTNTVQNTFVESFTCEKQIGPEGQATGAVYADAGAGGPRMLWRFDRLGAGD